MLQYVTGEGRCFLSASLTVEYFILCKRKKKKIYKFTRRVVLGSSSELLSDCDELI